MRLQVRLLAGAVSLGLVVLAGCSKSSSTSATSSTTKGAAATTTVPQDVTADKAAATSAALMLSDLPSGWTSAAHTDTQDTTGIDANLAKCLGVSVQDLNKSGPADVNSPDFSDANGNAISNSIGYTPSPAEATRQFALFAGAKVPDCLKTALGQYLQDQVAHPKNPADTLPPGITFGTAAVTPLSLSTIGDQTSAYRISVPISGQGITANVYVDLVVATKGRAGVEMDFTSIQTPFPSDQETKYMMLVVGRLTNT